MIRIVFKFPIDHLTESQHICATNIVDALHDSWRIWNQHPLKLDMFPAIVQLIQINSKRKGKFQFSHITIGKLHCDGDFIYYRPRPIK